MPTLPEHISLQPGKKIYFASDFHLGIPNHQKSIEREKHIVKWLNEVKIDAACIFLVGDLFDFWFEYKHVVPKGFVRLFGKLAELSDSGLPIYAFTGNHDLWMSGYFENELNIPVFHHPVQVKIEGKNFYIGHGDGLGPGDHGFKAMKKLFTNSLCKWLFRQLHPDIGIRLANYWSRRSRFAQGQDAEAYKGNDKEWLAIFCKEILQKEHFDYFIFGHRHLALDIKISDLSRYLNLGDWIKFNSYAVFDGKNLTLEYYNS